jgi:hypothetical protein
MSMPTPTRRRWFSFRLRTLLIVVALVAIPLAWIAKERRQSGYELQVAEKLHSLGISDVEIGGAYDWSRKYEPRASWRFITRYLLGDRILAIESDGDTSGLTSLDALEGLANLNSLWLTHAPVSDLEPLARLNNLEYLYLYNSRVSDLAPLANLQNLTRVNLCGADVSDLTPLKGLAKLQNLNVTNTRVSKEQVEALQKALPHCDIEHDPFP